jgi:hypothetical protein
MSHLDELMLKKLHHAPRWLKIMAILFVLTALLFSILVGWALSQAWRPMGKMATGQRLARMTQATQWNGEKFDDILPRVEPNLLKILPAWFAKPHPYRRPKEPLPRKNATRAAFSTPPETGLRITWLGHSTLILEIANKRVLIDPVWGEYVAPLPLKNARPLLTMRDAPQIDVFPINSGDEPVGGIGEPVVGTVPAAVANAVYNATGQRLHELPLKLS